MAYTLTQKLASLKPYEPIQGNYDIRLDANESFFNLPKSIKEEIGKEVTNLAFNRYPDPYAKNAVKAFSEFYGLNEKNVTAGNGSDELISVITSCFLKSGNNVVTLSPDFSMYAFYGDLYELNNYIYDKADNFTVNIDDLIAYCNNNKADMLIFSNPCNPSSLGLTKKEVIKLLNNVSCLVVLDEAYMDFWNESLLDKTEDYDNLIILKTCSKALGLAGIRFGFAIAGDTITNALKAAKSPYNTDMISQKIIEVVLSHKKELSDNLKQIILNNQELLKGINALNNKYNCFEKVYDSKTNFVFIKTDKCDYIFEKFLENSIAIRKFKGFLRISTGSKQENIKVLDTLEKIIKDMK